MSLTDDGNAESYMDAPPLAGLGGKNGEGGPSIIASILDLLGIHRQVSREPKAEKTQGGGGKNGDAKPATPATPDKTPPVVADVSNALGIPPRRSADSTIPMLSIDPDLFLRK